MPAKHPLRTIRGMVNDVLVSLDAEFERLYEGTGSVDCAETPAAGLAAAGVPQVRSERR